jgi:hypothetical protein
MLLKQYMLLKIEKKVEVLMQEMIIKREMMLLG